MQEAPSVLCLAPGAPEAGVGRRTLRAEEFARDVELLAPNNHELLTVEQLLGDNAGKAAQEMTLPVHDDLRKPEVSSSCMVRVEGYGAGCDGKGENIPLAQTSTCWPSCEG